MNYKKLQEFHDRLDHANSMIAQVYAHVTMMLEAAHYVGVFEHALGKLNGSLVNTVRHPLHQLQVDLYDFLGKNAPDVAVTNKSKGIILLFGKITLQPGDEHVLTWSERYSGGIRQLIEEGSLKEVVEGTDND